MSHGRAVRFPAASELPEPPQAVPVIGPVVFSLSFSGMKRPALRVERSQLGGRGGLGVEDRRHEAVGRVLGGWPSRIIDLVLDDAHGPSGPIGASGQLGAERAVRESLEVSECGVLLHAPNEITATFRELAEQLVGATEAPVGKDEHARVTGGGKWLGDGVLPLARAPILAANIAWVPHSASATMRIWGNTASPLPQW